MTQKSNSRIVIDTNRHGIRREIDHQFKPKKKVRPNRSKLNEVKQSLSTGLSTDNKELSTDIDITNENTINVGASKANYA